VNKTPHDDAVHHPSHYADGEIECIDAMRQISSAAEFAGFCRLSALKYLWRAGKKGAAAEDAAKAEVYTRWWKEALEQGDSEPVNRTVSP